MKLLVVEDDDALRVVLLRLLGQWGYATEVPPPPVKPGVGWSGSCLTC